MAAYIHRIETLVPPFVHRQEEVEEWFLSRIEDRRTRMLLKRSLRGSGIETRHSVCREFFSNELFDEKGQASTAARNRVYARESRQLASRVGKQLLENSSLSPDEVTHVIYATCTGFTNPGPDFHLIADLGLPSTVQRFVLGFMGCYSGVPALRMAKHICESDPDARVLVICLELCSLHLHLDPTYDSVLANSLFADGAGAALVAASSPRGDTMTACRLGEFFTDTIPEGEPDMDWCIGDRGFELILSNQIPHLIGGGAGKLTRKIVDPETIDHWAIHPGGRGILDQVESAVPLPPGKLDVPRDILKRYGNMAGATILFVIEEILKQSATGDEVLAMAFGPGLTVETGLLKAI